MGRLFKLNDAKVKENFFPIFSEIKFIWKSNRKFWQKAHQVQGNWVTKEWKELERVQTCAAEI